MWVGVHAAKQMHAVRQGFALDINRVLPSERRKGEIEAYKVGYYRHNRKFEPQGCLSSPRDDGAEGDKCIRSSGAEGAGAQHHRSETATRR